MTANEMRRDIERKGDNRDPPRSNQLKRRLPQKPFIKNRRRERFDGFRTSSSALNNVKQNTALMSQKITKCQTTKTVTV